MVDAVPTSDVVQAYLMGQRNAMEAAFLEALPQRQLLGAIQSALADVRGKQEDMGERCEALACDAAVVEEAARRTQAAVDAVARGNVPSLERALGELRARQDAVEAKVGERSLTSLCGEVGTRVFRSAIRQAARVDIVAAILARRILHVGPEVARGGGSEEGERGQGRERGRGEAEGSGDGAARYARFGGSGAEESQSGGGGGASATGYPWAAERLGAFFGDTAAAAGASDACSREALGTAMVVLAAESAFRLQRGLVRRTPRIIQRGRDRSIWP
jgi:hypothetical protein